ncbi:hypothetical protein [Bacillus coahuilensis]|uniref:hypothetical protein n=1 Tax=Bacillus coahuilensis TaxID=408580 RepID=UPI000185091C|nr:hypothetical protein [Bacillus coahuilensis]
MKNFGDLVQAGKSYIEDVEVDFAGEKYSIPVRPLGKDEVGRIQKLQSKGQETRGRLNQQDPSKSDMEIIINGSDSVEGNTQAEILAVSLAIADGQKHTVEEVKNLPAPIVTQLAKKVFQISGISTSKEQAKELEKS